MSLDLSTACPILRPSRLWLAGVPVDRMTMRQSLDWITGQLCTNPPSRPPILVMGPNAHIVTTSRRSPALGTALNSADLCLPDGVSVVLAGRLLGHPVPGRVAGGDFMEQLCALAARNQLSVFFLGGLPGAADGAASALKSRYPGLRVTTCCPPFRFEDNPTELETVLDTIRSAAPDILCVALGVPRQEIWMHRYCPSLPIRLAISVGAALDTQAGLRRRAPVWTRKLGIEWAYRLAREPRRLWRRYLIGNLHFLWLLAGAFVHRHLPAPHKPTPSAPVQPLSQKK